MIEQTLHQNTDNALEYLEDGTAVVIDDKAQEIFLLNVSAVQIYGLCEGKTRAEVVKESVELFKSSNNDVALEEQIMADVNSMIDDYLKSGIVYEK